MSSAGLALCLVTLWVLPAEFGIDPTGFGAWTGLTGLSPKEEMPQSRLSLPVDALYIRADPSASTPQLDDFDRPLPSLVGVNVVTQTAPFRQETRIVQLAAGEEVEYKVQLEEGQTLLYSWRSNVPLYTDFHAHQDEASTQSWIRYVESEGEEHHGQIVAPFTGDHGWYWINVGDAVAEIRLSVAGYYGELREIPLDNKS